MLGTGQLQSVGLVGCLSLAQPLSYYTITITLPSRTSVPQDLTPHTSMHLSPHKVLQFILFSKIYFCLLTIFSASRISPCLYRESVITSILFSAAILYWSASALVFLRPSDLFTRLQAVSTSPGELNFLLISLSSSGNSWLANRTGPVARPSPRSATAGLPAGKYLSCLSQSQPVSTHPNPSHLGCLQLR